MNLNEYDAEGEKLWQDESREFYETHSHRMLLGECTTDQLLNDPKRQLFVFSRYKFAAKLIGEDKQAQVLEFGCGEGLGTKLLDQVAANVLAIDFDERRIAWSNEQLAHDNLAFRCESFMNKQYGKFDYLVSLDVIEHLHQKTEDAFLQTICKNLHPQGCAIIGTPNITSVPYASEASQRGHINMYDGMRLKTTFQKYFHNVFLFGMNDEVIHTGFTPMCHYLFVLACSPKG